MGARQVRHRTVASDAPRPSLPPTPPRSRASQRPGCDPVGPRAPVGSTRGEAPSGAEANAPPGPAGFPTGPDFGAEARRLACGSLSHQPGCLIRAPPRMLDPGHLGHTTPTRAGAPHGASPRHLSFTGPRVRGGGCGRSDPPGGLAASRASASSRAPRRLRPGLGRRGRPPLPFCPRQGQKPRRSRAPTLAMLLAQRSPPAQKRLRGPKGRWSRRRPGARAGDPTHRGTAPPPHRPHHRTMPR